MSRAARAAGFVAFLLATLFVLRRAATGDLAAPPLGSLHDLEAWVDARSAAGVAVALVRLAAEVAVWYVLAVSLLHGVAATLGAQPLRVVADAVTVPAARTLVHAALGVGLVAVAPAATRLTVPSPGTATMAPADVGPRADGSATMRPESEPGGTGTAGMVPRSTAPAVPPAGAGAPAIVEGTVWRVAPDESLWSIAQDVLAERWQRPPTDPEIDPYWRALIATNRDRLVDPENPDLLLPGQVLDLPAPPAVRSRVQN